MQQQTETALEEN